MRANELELLAFLFLTDGVTESWVGVEFGGWGAGLADWVIGLDGLGFTSWVGGAFCAAWVGGAFCAASALCLLFLVLAALT